MRGDQIWIDHEDHGNAWRWRDAQRLQFVDVLHDAGTVTTGVAGQQYFVDGERGWHRSAAELRNIEVQLGHELTTSR